MTDQQKLSKAIQDEIHRCNMRELALNSLRWRHYWDDMPDGCNIDAKIIASIPDDAEMREKPFTHDA